MRHQPQREAKDQAQGIILRAIIAAVDPKDNTLSPLAVRHLYTEARRIGKRFGINSPVIGEDAQSAALDRTCDQLVTILKREGE